jgi:hypothetical protein
MDPDVAQPTQPMFIYQFHYPSTKKVALHTLFRTQHVPSKENLAKTTSIRDELVAALDSGSAKSIYNVFRSSLIFGTEKF